jgi:hypothetical protein
MFILRCRKADVFAIVSLLVSLTPAKNFVVTCDKFFAGVIVTIASVMELMMEKAFTGITDTGDNLSPVTTTLGIIYWLCRISPRIFI